VRPQVKLLNETAQEVKIPGTEHAVTISFPVGALIVVRDGQLVGVGEVLARIPTESQKTRDITGGLPRVAELFEARSPKDAGTLAEVTGTVTFGKETKGKQRLIITDLDGKEHEFLIPKDKHVLVHDGQVVNKGESIVDGPADPHDILRLLGIEALARYIVDEVQDVYRLQGVKINDKHIEVIVRQMLRRVQISDPGDAPFITGEQVERSELLDENDKAIAKGGRPAIYENVLLGITGSPLGTSDSQSVSNKTLGNTNTITVKDNLLTLQNASDVTKQANFSLAGNSTGTIRTYTLPNASVTLASLTGTENLTNKTLTNPTITGGTIDNTSITVDSISGHTTSTIVTVGGVQMSNGIVATTGAVNTNSIAAGAVVPNSLVASSGSGWAWQSFTPTWTNLTLGNAVQTAHYAQIGKLVRVIIRMTFGTTSVMGTGPYFTPPVTAHSIYNDGSTNFLCGWASYLNGPGVAGFNANSTKIALFYLPTSSSIAAIDATHPGTFTSGSVITVDMSYEAA